jgi:hypothetical protein
MATAMLATIAASKSSPSVYEGFSYVRSQNVVATNSGIGWATNSAWRAADGTTNSMTYLSNSLTFAASSGTSGNLVVSGGRVSTLTNREGIWRDLPGTVSNTTTFVSFLIKCNNSQNTNSYGGVSLFDSTNEVCFIGELFGKTNQLGIYLPLQRADDVFPNVSPNNVNFVVAKIEPSSSNITFYLNPTNLGNQESNNGRLVAGINPFAFSRLRIESGGGNQSIEVDEIRIGTNWSSVVPIDTDADSDGLLTSAELDAGTDPLQIDSNGDGFRDGEAVSLANSLGVEARSANFSPFSALMQQIAATSPSRFGLYTTTSIMDLRMGGLIVAKQGDVATFVIDTQVTTNLHTQPFSNIGERITNYVTMPGNTGFLRIQAIPAAE